MTVLVAEDRLIPDPELPEMRLRRADVEPPMVLPAALLTRTPPAEFPRATAPPKSRPMILPAMRFPAANAPLIDTPWPLFPEMTLREPGDVPPMVLPGDETRLIPFAVLP